MNRRCRLLRDNGCKSADLIGLIKYLPWGLATQRLQRNQTLPIFAKGVACKTIFYDEHNRNKPIVEKSLAHIQHCLIFNSYFAINAQEQRMQLGINKQT